MPVVQKRADELTGRDLSMQVTVVDIHGVNHSGVLVRVDHEFDLDRPVQGPFLQLLDPPWMGRVRGTGPVLVDVPVAGVQS